MSLRQTTAVFFCLLFFMPAHIRKDESGAAVRCVISCVGFGDFYGFRTVNTGNRTKDTCQCGVVSFNAGFCRIVSIEFVYLIKKFFKAR